ncbi:MAG TPA: DUF4198 domain-containing protein [Ramlibacter sp.]|nr:DUF4198 domain-containing protein [Ramlibacter sp.]
MTPQTWRAAVFAALCLAASQGRSHDSWLSPSRGDGPNGPLVLELATGNRYPVQEFSQAPASVAQSGCTDGAARMPLRPERVHPQRLDLRAGVAEPGAPVSCWVELAAADIEIEPARVEVYFAEIKASSAHREAWAAMRARGMPWRETYRKFARIELASDSAAPAPTARVAAARRPAELDLEIVLMGEQPISVGQPLEFQVLRDGRPLPGFAVELVSERSALGIWGRTDADGKLRHRLPFAGRWLLRGTDLRLSVQRPGTWESRFVTLAIEAPQAGS